MNADPVNEPTRSPSPKAIFFACLALACLAVVAGGYLLGRSSGADIDAAQAAGADAGRVKGAERGAGKGYASGYRRGHRLGFQQIYPRAYKLAYRDAFDGAGLQLPALNEIEVK
jgi:hypothetical protein